MHNLVGLLDGEAVGEGAEVDIWLGSQGPAELPSRLGRLDKHRQSRSTLDQRCAEYGTRVLIRFEQSRTWLQLNHSFLTSVQIVGSTIVDQVTQARFQHSIAGAVAILTTPSPA